MNKPAVTEKIILNAVFIIMCVAVLLPFLLIMSVSFSNELDIGMYGYRFIPKRIDLTAYRFVFSDPSSVINAYKVTTFSTVFGTILSLLLMSLIAYPLSRKNFGGRNFVSFYLFVTMLFSGGMVPSYILNTQYLHLDDTIWIYIIPSLINAWNIFLLRTFFSGLPDSIIESAYIDGASEFRILFTMVLPLSKPVLATVALLVSLARWNEWLIPTLYITRNDLVSLQYLLQKILLNVQLLQQNSKVVAQLGFEMQTIPSETVRMAMAIIVAGPMLVVFPFFQKYFVRGLTIGSVKG